MSNNLEQAISSVAAQLSREQRAALLNCHLFDELIADAIVCFEADTLPKDLFVSCDPIGYAKSYLSSFVYG